MKKMYVARKNVFAKLNLTLDLLGVENGYHLLDSLVLNVNLADKIVARKRRDGLVSVNMHGMGSESIPPERNNAQRAGEAFVNAFKTSGAEIDVYKDIPIGAGLGGSSADAAGVLLAMAKLYEVEAEKLKPLADALGSDTGYLLTGGFARLRGRGEQVERMGKTPKLHILLLVPEKGVSTAECYALSDRFQRGEPHTERALECLGKGMTDWAAKLFYNDLFPAAKELEPDVGRAFEELRQFSPLGVSMTGSGSGVFALFETEELCRWAKSRYRGKFRAYVLASREPKQRELHNPFSLGEED